MAIDFSQDIKTAERQMNTYIRRGQKVPRDVLDHYTKLLSGTLDSQTVENGGNSSTSSAPQGSLNPGTFPTVSDTDSVILSADTDRSYVLIQNTGNETVFINFGSAAAVNGGLKIIAGGSWSSTFPQFAETEIHAIAEANTSTLTIYTIG